MWDSLFFCPQSKPCFFLNLCVHVRVCPFHIVRTPTDISKIRTLSFCSTLADRFWVTTRSFVVEPGYENARYD